MDNDEEVKDLDTEDFPMDEDMDFLDDPLDKGLDFDKDKEEDPEDHFH